MRGARLPPGRAEPGRPRRPGDRCGRRARRSPRDPSPDRRARAVQLVGRAGRAARPRRGRRRPGLPGQHRDEPDPRRERRDRAPAAVPDLLPHRRHRRRPGPGGGHLPARTEGKRRVAVVSDGKTYGEGIAEEFAKQLATQGGQVVARVTAPPGTPRAQVVTDRGRRAPRRGVLRRRVPRGRPAVAPRSPPAGVSVPVMGGDGVVNPGYVTAGGREGDLGTSVGPPPETLPARPRLRRGLPPGGLPGELSARTGRSRSMRRTSSSTPPCARLAEDGEWTPGAASRDGPRGAGIPRRRHHGADVVRPLRRRQHRRGHRLPRRRARWAVVGPAD